MLFAVAEDGDGNPTRMYVDDISVITGSSSDILWEDGRPVREHTNTLGDGTVLRASVELGIGTPSVRDDEHIMIPHIFRSDVVDYIGRISSQRTMGEEELANVRASATRAQSADFSTYLQFDFLGPITALVIDPQGRRVGYDPVQKLRVKDIEKSMYIGNENRTLSVTIFDPLPGNYRVEVEGTGEGDYKIVTTHSEDDLKSPGEEVKNETAKGYSSIYLFDLESLKFILK